MFLATALMSGIHPERPSLEWFRGVNASSKDTCQEHGDSIAKVRPQALTRSGTSINFYLFI
jgi:hypothetical protein